MSQTQIIGKAAEDFACKFLLKQGLRLITRNFYCRSGEIDLIMQDKEHLVFIEVRYRNSNIFGSAVESITYNKQQKLLKAANYYLSQNKLIEKVACRFDVVAITSLQSEKNTEWIKNAF